MNVRPGDVVQTSIGQSHKIKRQGLVIKVREVQQDIEGEHESYQGICCLKRGGVWK